MAPKINFLGQPYDEDASTGAFLRRLLTDDRYDRFTAVVAWARFRGVRRISDELGALRGRSGTSRLIVGIDEGIATRPGLIVALRYFSEVYVLHDRPGLTFHPKLYLAEGKGSAALLVGSGNLTAGGLFSNYEASIGVTFALPDDSLAPALVDARAYIDRLLSDTAICRKLDAGLVEELVGDARYGVSARELRLFSRNQLPPGLEPEDIDQTADEIEADEPRGRPIFGSSAHAKAGVPALPMSATRELEEIESADDEPAPSPAPAGSSGRSRRSQKAANDEVVSSPREVRRPSQPVLVAELSKSRGATQANFHLEHYEGYFGAVKGEKRALTLRRVPGDGSLGRKEPRETVEAVVSGNYRLELDGLRGRDYPSGDETPIVALVQRHRNTFYYQALWPGDPGHSALYAYLDRVAGKRHGRRPMRQRRATIDELQKAYPESPLLLALNKI
jgi:hypothetical protein